MKRREFITLVGGAATFPLAARAQQPERIRRIGVLMAHAESDPEGQAFVAAFREVLQKLGWVEGRNVRIDTRWAAEVELMPGFAKELIALQPDLILANNTPTTAAVLQQTTTIPTVFAVVADPVGSGFVASLARPGGNVTGFTLTEPTMTSKWLELLKEIAPHVTRVAILSNPDASPASWFASGMAAAPKFAVEVVAALRDSSEIEAAMTQWGRAPNFGLILVPDPMNAHRGLSRQARSKAERLSVRVSGALRLLASPAPRPLL
jgi:putative tryptophan/tyrosine transport system substrate-binding protein